MNDKVKLLETSGSLYTYYYTLGDTVDYYYGNLLPSTGFIWLFDIVKYYDGLLLRLLIASFLLGFCIFQLSAADFCVA